MPREVNALSPVVPLSDLIQRPGAPKARIRGLD